MYLFALHLTLYKLWFLQSSFTVFVIFPVIPFHVFSFRSFVRDTVNRHTEYGFLPQSYVLENLSCCSKYCWNFPDHIWNSNLEIDKNHCTTKRSTVFNIPIGILPGVYRVQNLLLAIWKLLKPCYLRGPSKSVEWAVHVLFIYIFIGATKCLILVVR